MKNKRKKAVFLAAFAALFATAGLSACGGTVNDSGVLNSASEAEHEHRYGEWTVTKEATCTEAGSKQRVCGICGKPETEIIPAGHTYEDGICTVCGEKEPSEGLEYTLNSDNGGYSVTGIGSCTDTDIVIPSSYEGKTVTGIDRAFENCSWLTSVVIPDSVTVIGDYAFRGCSGLTSITVVKGNKVYHSNGNCLIETESKTLIAGCKNSVIPKDGSVTSIGGYAFYGCNGLTSIEIPDGVTCIGDYAFCDCSGLTSVTLGNGVTDIGVRAFDSCNGLTGELIIPDSVTSIGAYAFYHCSGLTGELIIPDRAN